MINLEILDIQKIDFDKMNGLIPAVIQDDKTSEVLMLGFMNEQALQTLNASWLLFTVGPKKDFGQKVSKAEILDVMSMSKIVIMTLF